MYTRKLTTKTKARKGKRTIGKRVGKSVNKNRKNRNNNRRTKRAGFNALKNAAINSAIKSTKYLQIPNASGTLDLARSAASVTIQNVKAGNKILNILKNPRLTNDEKFNQSVVILKEVLINNANLGKKGVKAFVRTDKVKADANKFVNRQKAAFTGNLAVRGKPALLNQRSPINPSSSVQPPIVPAGYQQFGQPRQQQGGPFQNFVR